MAAIEVDPVTGLKVFDTRAAKASDRIAGDGYGVIDDRALKTLPDEPPGAVFNAEEQAKYRAFKEARRGAADYMDMEGQFRRYLDDIYSESVLIYATGFRWMATSTFNMIVGRDGRTLSEKWRSEGTKTFLGVHSNGFPNPFIVSEPQGGGGSFNFATRLNAERHRGGADRWRRASCRRRWRRRTG